MGINKINFYTFNFFEYYYTMKSFHRVSFIDPEVVIKMRYLKFIRIIY